MNYPAFVLVIIQSIDAMSLASSLLRKLRKATEEMEGDHDACKAAVAQDGECRAAPTIAPGGNVCLWSTEPRLLKILLEN